MAKNNFKPFATAANANVTPQAEWENNPALLSGFSAGKASSSQVNKAIRQASFVASALAQYIVDTTKDDVLDNGNLSTLVSQLTKALNLTGDFRYLAIANNLSDLKDTKTALKNLGGQPSGNYANKDSGASQDFKGPITSEDNIVTISPSKANKLVLSATDNDVSLVVYKNGEYSGAITIPTKTGTLALTSDLSNFADKSSASEQLFKGQVSSTDGITAKSGTSKITLTSQNGPKIVVYTDDAYRGGINIPLQDGTMALTSDVNNVSGMLMGITQTWQNVKGGRSAGVNYTNSTGRPIAVSIAGIMGTNKTGVQLSLAVGGVEASSFALTQSNFDIRGNIFSIVPPGATYNLTASNITSILTWSELR